MASVREVPILPYTMGQPTCSVVSITPPNERHMHTYYDVSPWSPSNRYFVCLRLPMEDRLPHPDEEADLCVIDLKERTIRTVCQTSAWGGQTAAHQMWGRTDRYLYFNDKRNDQPVGVRLDRETGEATHFEGTIWQVSPDETCAISPCLIRCNLTQRGYGVSVATEQQRANIEQAPPDDGLFRTDLRSGEKSLLISLADVWEVIPNKDDLKDTTLYAFHAKFNPRGDRILLVVRALPREGRYHPMLLTCWADGSDLHVIVPSWRWLQQPKGGHPLWHPNGQHVLMNLSVEGSLRFCLIDADTGEVRVLVDAPPGGGHPSISSDERQLVTDVFHWPSEEKTRRAATIRLVDLEARTWRHLCTAESPFYPEEFTLRVDAHPAWDQRGRRICFQAAPTGRRQVFVVDPSLPPGAVPNLSEQVEP